MKPENFTEYHRSLLITDLTKARKTRLSKTAYANALAEKLPPTGDLDWDIKLWIKGGNIAAHMCAWAAFVAPILLILHLWD
jgi:hypothetical protein